MKAKFSKVFLFLIVFFVNSLTSASDTLVIKKGLMIKLPFSRSNVITPNPITSQIELGKWKTPQVGDEIKIKDNESYKWQEIIADNSGWFKNEALRNAFIFLEYNSDKEQIVLLEAMGHENVYVNGVIRSGNPYRFKDTYEDWEPRFDYSLIPIQLHKGKNEFLFECNRGVLKAKLHFNNPELIFNEYDLTLPDILINEPVNLYGAIPIINASEKFYKNLSIKISSQNSNPVYTSIKIINPLSIYKAPFQIVLPPQNQKGEIELKLYLVEKQNDNEKVLAETKIKLRVLLPEDTHKETFISKLDGSVQYYAVNPPENLKSKPALFLSLHGAGVEAINQANSYGHKNWGYIVAPTNRRPYGFNWENWGRIDALEVLDIAMKKFNIDENRVYLTGHSMGGHGTWHLGINYPDKFAAIGPSAGWISIWSYRIRSLVDTTKVKEMLLRSARQSDTYKFAENLNQNGIYIIHGDADDNVPISQAQSMVDVLSKFHKDFQFHIEKGAGHWWDNSDESGANCVDWLPMFDFFSRHSIPSKERVKSINYVTSNLAISSKNNWIEIINQKVQQDESRIDIKLEFGKRKFIGTTKNIELLGLDVSMLPNDKTFSVELDNQHIKDIKVPESRKIYLKNQNNEWRLYEEPSKKNKNPERCGNIREVLNNDVIFVYGTHGNKEENKWAYEKARYDAEKLWYQGNASIELIKDDDFKLEEYKNRNVVLFGNANTNSAWKLLFEDSPIQIMNGKLKIGDREYKGKNFACLIIRPRKDSDIASVAAISGTGIKGMRISNFAAYHHPYINLPDVVIYDDNIVKSDDDGVKFIGYFGNDWKLESGEFINKF
ncbi:MAG: prolyl oligopeptidase family serine peptidase [Melioribacter sp.]|uniref:carboxylesterase family protein n=1 Tax=Rosettibacter primus TaxID=3111523 RepID=UPI00247B4BB1|nr:prolyl oligopeptidase family serine peptidase [Melioribacter sp.]